VFDGEKVGGEMKKWAIWMEGFRVMEGESKAVFQGEIEAESFKDACRILAEQQEWGELFKADPPSYWGCRLFDDEKKARKSFG
jgi:hypothetical protein